MPVLASVRTGAALRTMLSLTGVCILTSQRFCAHSAVARIRQEWCFELPQAAYSGVGRIASATSGPTRAWPVCSSRDEPDLLNGVDTRRSFRTTSGCGNGVVESQAA